MIIIKPLFGEEDEEEVVPLPEEKFSQRDKIFNNDFNTGNLEFEEYGPPKVDQDFIDQHMDNYYDSNNYHANIEIMKRLDDFFTGSEIGKSIGMKRKIPKQIIPKLYISLKDCFKEGELTESEFFTVLAEYFNMSYEVFYENIPAIYRESIVRELDIKYDVLKRKRQHKLF